MEQEKYLICEDSPEGIFTGVYEAYALKEGHEHTHLQVGEVYNYSLFATCVNIIPDTVKADKVLRTVRVQLGEEAYCDICRAAASCNIEDKGEAIYKTIVDGITNKSGRRVMQNLKNPYVRKTFELARSTGNELHYEIEFVRFRELSRGILFSTIGPKNNVLPFIMPHFADRLSIENFIICDEKRNLYGVHPACKEWYLVQGDEKLRAMNHEFSEKEDEYCHLFTLFHKTIGIKERENYKLQRQMMPLRYQDYMPELPKNAKNVV